MALVFNEILILHFCDFDENIESNLKLRADKELMAKIDFEKPKGDSTLNNITINSLYSDKSFSNSEIEMSTYSN